MKRFQDDYKYDSNVKPRDFILQILYIRNLY